MTASDAEPAFSRSAELRTIWRIAMPAAVMVAFKNACLVTDQAMLGHLLDASGKPTDLYLDAAALALLLINLSYSAFMRGIAGATNTLTSQALGAGNRRLVGTWLLGYDVERVPLQIERLNDGSNPGCAFVCGPTQIAAHERRTREDMQEK